MPLLLSGQSEISLLYICRMSTGSFNQGVNHLEVDKMFSLFEENII